MASDSWVLSKDISSLNCTLRKREKPNQAKPSRAEKLTCEIPMKTSHHESGKRRGLTLENLTSVSWCCVPRFYPSSAEIRTTHQRSITPHFPFLGPQALITTFTEYFLRWTIQFEWIESYTQNKLRALSFNYSLGYLMKWFATCWFPVSGWEIPLPHFNACFVIQFFPLDEPHPIDQWCSVTTETGNYKFIFNGG